MASPQNPQSKLPRLTRFNRPLAESARNGVNAYRVFLVISTIITGIYILILLSQILPYLRYGRDGGQVLFFMFLFIGLAIFGLVAMFRFIGAVQRTVDLIERTHTDLEKEMDQMRDAIRGKSSSPLSAVEEPGFFEEGESGAPRQKPPAKDDDFLL